MQQSEEIRSLRQELRRELLRVNQQLCLRDSELAEKNRQLSELDKQLAQKSKQLAQKSQDVERLILWFEELRAGVSALLRSRQWRAGRVVGELHRRFLLRPRVPTALDYMETVTEKFKSWHKSHERSKDTLERTGPREPSLLGEELAREIRGRIGSAPERADWPPVSIVVLNRNGLGHLERLFTGLRDRTDYSNFEVILVDNGSTDGSVDYVKSFEAGFPVRLIENSDNTLFSTGNDQGAEVASNELLLFLNNDIEPFEPGWLKEQVHCLERSEASAAGALLLYPSGDDHRTASGYAIQHRGIRFRRDSTLGVVRAYNLGNDDALGDHLGVDVRCPAVTAACLLIRREAFDTVGGFTEGYRYGQEDVDLGLKLSASGRKVVSGGRSVLFHHEFGTQSVEGRDFMRINRMNNWRLLLERWGPQLHRELLLDRLDSTGFWSEGPAHVVITVAGHDMDGERDDRHAAHDLGDALMRRGWRVTYVERSEWYSLPEGADYLLVLLDCYDVSRVSGVTTVAWVRARPERWVQQSWFEEFDVVLAASGALAEKIGQGTSKMAHLFPLATNPELFARTPPNPVYEADYVFTGDRRDASLNLVNHLDVAPKERFMVFGEGWEEVPRLTRYARGHLPYEQLPQVYSSARLLLDAADYPNHGAVASRVFNALAAGTLVVTDRESGARELFDEDFPTYGTRQELREKLDLLLNDAPRRAALAERYREVVLREHTYERRARQLAEMLHERVETVGFCIKVDVPYRGLARFSDELVRARAVRRQLERRGHPCIIQILDEWDDFEGLKYDVVLHLKGPTPYVPKPSQVNVLWDVGHLESPTVRECDRYDLVFVASDYRAGQLRSRTSTPVAVLEPATDPEVFFPDPEPVYRCELVFVGDAHEGGGRILRDLFPTDRDLAVWGEGWEGLIGAMHIVGAGMTDEQVRKAYSSASAVLVGHRNGVREPGVVSSRVYDALACGALVISDGPPELNERFGDAVITYDSPYELRRLLEHYLASPEEREEKGRRGREMVLTHHTLEQRVEELRWRVEEFVEESGFRTRIRPLVRTE